MSTQLGGGRNPSSPPVISESFVPGDIFVSPLFQSTLHQGGGEADNGQHVLWSGESNHDYHSGDDCPAVRSTGEPLRKGNCDRPITGIKNLSGGVS